MAQKVQVVLVDDVDGGEAAETVSFSLDGVGYEIDLSEANASALRDAFGPWIAAGRRVSGRRSAGRGRGRGSSDAGKIREWAKENGYKVSERGRVSAEIREAYANSK
ncbi:histone-like nucleoid-structuring protein Lsr2 [Demequina sp.]|uniref:histone-like nucleoid-structuring protein Lsr2 n=1 Tax=Demequina sp. TaxID=2050685 RepID=UPI003D14465B